MSRCVLALDFIVISWEFILTITRDGSNVYIIAMGREKIPLLDVKC